MPGAVKEGLPPVIQRLIKWRLRNQLSQRGAVEVMMRHGLKVSRTTLQHWEQKVSAPNNLASKAIQDFLKQHPKIKNPPRYKPGPK
jgi:DNA-binding transcriptional regulator YiaG